MMFQKVLIANRGEIAIRIAKTLHQMGIAVAALYTETDEHALHLRYADEAHLLPGTSLAETYLDAKKIAGIAKACQAEAIHPGYGFLSENPSLPKACQEAEVAFIGPDPDVLRRMGDKLLAKQVAIQAGVPIIPGSPVEMSSDPQALKQKAGEIGYPILIKPTAGGGGKGVHLISHESEFDAALLTAQSEAKSSFGDERVFIEKCLLRPRHIEVQIMADLHGHISHLFERECSVQRRYQKIIEETPAAFLTPARRALMGHDAVKIAEASGYTNAGTVEFLVDEAGSHYFLEMNARLQVEHPITEMTLRTDLVRLQVEAAAGKELSLLQIELRPLGHAIECRIYAENPDLQFLPATGIIRKYIPPDGPNIRVDGGILEGTVISTDYDPLLAKLIVWGESRREALSRMSWALKHFVLLGVTTNLEFLQTLVLHPEFQKGELHTRFIEEYSADLKCVAGVPDEAILVAACLGHSPSKQRRLVDESAATSIPQDPWSRLGAWRLNAHGI